MTMGIVPVAFLAATAAGVGVATMTSTLSRTSSAARSGRPVESALGKAILDDDILALDPPELAQPLTECLDEMGVSGGRAAGEIPYAVDLSRWLRLGGERYREEADDEQGCDRNARHDDSATVSALSEHLRDLPPSRRSCAT